jgi:hypothetical protein
MMMKPYERSGGRAIRRLITVMLSTRRLAFFSLFLAGILAGCATLRGPKYPTLIPTEYVPTAIALTVEAGRPVSADTPAAIPGATNPPVPSSTAAAEQPTAEQPPAEQPPASQTATALPPLASSPAATRTPRTVGTPTRTRTAEKTTPGSLPTATASLLTAEVGVTPTPGATATETPTLGYYRTRTPTATPGIPKAAILWYSPGQMSRLTSPIQFSASLEPGPSGKVEIVLLSEDGRILYRKLIRYTTQDWVLVSDNVEFSIAAAAETARLQISTEDEHGRMMALASVDLVLLAMGDDDLNPPTDLLEPLIIREPVPNTLIMGGKVVVTGLVRTSGEQPLMVELVDAKGAVVGYRQALVTLPADPWATDGYATFKAEVPYSVDEATWVRLAVSAFEDRLPGPTHLSSLVILLGP